ncbi:cytochrome P450 monooxygenase [Halenospora varia]|nr:cytochrome P450 monooxygenase [Halenospora varia]
MVLIVAVSFVSLLLLSYNCIFYPAFSSPLSAIPNAHFTSASSNVWLLVINDAHERLGPVVRLGPDELSVNSAEGLKVIYSHNFDKDMFYTRFENYGIPNMFSTIQREAHTRRRRLLGNIYSKSTLHSSPQIQELSKAILIQPPRVFELISAYIFGLQNGSNYVQNTKVRKRWASEFPFVSSWLLKLGICLDDPRIYSSVEEANERCLKMFMNQLRSSAEKPSIDQLSESQTQLIIASKPMDHLIAATETSGWTLVYIMHELSQRPDLQASLRNKLLSLVPSILYHNSAKLADNNRWPIVNLPSHRSIDTLPLLDEIVFESLRLHSPVPGSQPCVTPTTNSHTTTTILGYSNVPPGIRVSSQAYSLHRNSKVFPDPESWKPERWQEPNQEERSEMVKIKLVVAAIYSNYTTRIVDDAGIEQLDG